MPHLSCRAEDKDLTDYKPADIAMALCRMVSYNIAQLAYLNAKKEGINRIFFGGKYGLITSCTASDGGVTAHGVPHRHVATCRLFHSGAPGDHGDYQLCHRILVEGEQVQAFKGANPRWCAPAGPVNGLCNMSSVLLCWQGTMKALFLRHEGKHRHTLCTQEDDVVLGLGFDLQCPLISSCLCLGAGYLGAVGAFLSVHPMAGAAVSAAVASGRDPRKVSEPRLDMAVQRTCGTSRLGMMTSRRTLPRAAQPDVVRPCVRRCVPDSLSASLWVRRQLEARCRGQLSRAWR